MRQFEAEESMGDSFWRTFAQKAVSMERLLLKGQVRETCVNQQLKSYPTQLSHSTKEGPHCVPINNKSR